MVVMDDEEEYFPRGGSTKGHKKSVKSDRTYIFETKKPQTVTKKKPGRKERLREKAKQINLENEEEGNEELSEQHFEENLEPFTYQNLTDGTLSLCCITQVRPNFLMVSLPEKKLARIPMNLISQPFKKLIEEDSTNVPSLSDYFSLGHCYPCRIVDVTNTHNYYEVTATTDPCMINHNIPHNLVCTGFILAAAIQSCEDHGFIMATGIKGLNAFLPNSRIGNHSGNLGVGRLIWCKVIKSTPSETSNLVTLTAIPEKISSAKLKAVTSSEILTPGVQVNVTVVKITPKRLYVKELSSKESGYIPVSHLEQVWSKTSDYQVGVEYAATVLYKFPHVNVVCYSMRVKPENVYLPKIRVGTLFKAAKVISKDNLGVYVKLEHDEESYKGVIPMWKLQKTVEKEILDSLFPIGNSIKVRVLNFNNLDGTYSCTTSDDVIKKRGHISDFKVGQVVEIKITKRVDKGFFGSIDTVNVFIPLSHIVDELVQNPDKKIKINNVYNGRIWSISENSAIATLRPSLVNNKPFTEFTNLNQGDEYYGKVLKILVNGILVAFFNDITIMVSDINLPKMPNKYKIGELVKCYVLESFTDKKPHLSVVKPLGNMKLMIGSYYTIIVKTVSNKGLNCIILENKKPVACIVPVEHLCDCLQLCPALLKNYEIGKKIKAILYTFDDQVPVFSLRYSVDKFFQDYQLIKQEGLYGLKKDDTLPATVSEMKGNNMLLDVPVSGYNGKLTAPIPKNLQNLLQINQGINVVVKNVDLKIKTISVFCKDSDNQLTYLRKQLKCFLKELSKLQTRKSGEEIQVKMVSIKDNKIEVSLTDDNSKGIITKRCDKSFQMGEVINTILLYEDPLNNVYNLCYKSKDLNEGDKNGLRIVHINKDFCVGISISNNDVIFLNPINSEILKKWNESCKKSFIKSNIVIFANEIRTCGQFKHGCVQWTKHIEAILGSKNKKKLSPVKNDESEDIEEDFSNKEAHSDEDMLSVDKEMSGNEEDMSDNEQTISENENVKENMSDSEEDIEEELELPKVTDKKKNINKKVPKINENLKRKSAQENLVSTKKKRLNDNSDSESENTVLVSDKLPKKTKAKQCEDSKAAKSLKGRKLKELENLSLEVGGFDWNATPNDLAKAVARGKMDYVKEDSDEEIEVKKKRKLTPAEKKAAQIEAERIIREKEEELLRCEENPQSADHFDRILLTNPNNSKLWIQYMAFHLQGTDIDKARSVAKRALKQINVREEKERLNVWIALLNLENIYGSSEIFEQTLSEALKYNDDYQVYIKVLGMYCETQKIAELDKLTNHLVRKFKEKTDCWYECQSALMKVGLTDKARNFLQRSLSSLPQKEHISLISRFALLENKHGFKEQAQSLFENLITSYPQRVDLWNVYVDMLVKSDRIDLARGVLERICSHKLPVRKMRTIYKKWLQFEEKYGTEKAVENVRKAAEAYVSDLLAPKEKKDSEKNEEADSELDDDSSDSDVDDEIKEKQRKPLKEGTTSEDDSEDDTDDDED